jgi:hypothetical protein
VAGFRHLDGEREAYIAEPNHPQDRAAIVKTFREIHALPL